MRKQTLFLGVAILFLWSLTACQIEEISTPTEDMSLEETELYFETIEQVCDNVGSAYSGSEPYVVLVTTSQDTNQLEGLISQDALDQLAELDFGRYFAIALFRGRQGSSGYDTFIERVARQGEKIIIYAQFWDRTRQEVVIDAETSPYHLVKVYGDSDVNQETELVLRGHMITPTPLR